MFKDLVAKSYIKVLNKEIYILDFVPPVLVGPLKKIRSLVKGYQDKGEDGPSESFISPNLKSYSQFNEDLLIDLILGLKDNGFYLDIGANDPVIGNNTKRFYDKGWSGINIEPGPNAIKKFYEYRIRDINLNIGVGSTKGNSIFYQLEESSLSSFNIKNAKNMAAKSGSIITEIPIDVFRLVDIVDQYIKGKQVDFMSVDTEGSDLAVLQSNNWDKFRPTLIIVEIDNQYTKIVEFMEQCNYLLVYNNLYNGIFIDKLSSEKCLKNILGDIK